VPEDEKKTTSRKEKNEGEKGDGKESKVYAGKVTKYRISMSTIYTPTMQHVGRIRHTARNPLVINKKRDENR